MGKLFIDMKELPRESHQNISMIKECNLSKYNMGRIKKFKMNVMPICHFHKNVSFKITNLNAVNVPKPLFRVSVDAN